MLKNNNTHKNGNGKHEKTLRNLNMMKMMGMMKQ